MLIRNKRTGVVWDITDEAHLKRLLDDPKHYEEVKPEKKAKAEG